MILRGNLKWEALKRAVNAKLRSLQKNKPGKIKNKK